MKMMKKRLVAMILALVLVSSLGSFAPTRVSCSPDVHHVDSRGWPWGEFESIQEAVNSQNVTDGDYVIVYQGTYHESPCINKSLKIWGSGEITIIDGGGTGNVVTIVSSNVEFKDFKIQNSGNSSAAVCITNSSHGNRISNNKIGLNCGYGILLTSGVVNNSICNNTISYVKQHGIYLSDSSFNNITMNKISNIYEMDGIHLEWSEDNSIIDNQASTSRHGLFLNSSWNNAISGNKLFNNREYGIFLERSGNNTLSANEMTGNHYNFGLECISLQEFNQTIYTSNKVDGKPIYYLVNKHYQTVSGAGFVAIINSTNIDVLDSTLEKNCYGVIFANTNNSKISGVESLYNERYGIYLWASNNNIVNYSTISQNLNYGGIGLEYSNDNAILINTVGPNNPDGILLKACSNNEIKNNLIQHNTKHGIHIYNSINTTIGFNTVEDNAESGICLENSENNTLANNTCKNPLARGIQLLSSENNTIRSNFITHNMEAGITLDNSSFNEIYLNSIGPAQYRGINLTRSSNNRIYHNDFIDSVFQASADAESVNTWDNGYPLPNPLPVGGGNYWSDYKDRYPNATEIDDSGIWDTPYVINANNTDRYPLMISIHSIAITNVTVSNTTAGRGETVYINVTVANLGVSGETFVIIIYCNTTEIPGNTTTLAGRSSTIIFDQWHIAENAVIGNYTISAYATPVLGETETDDNRYVDGMVQLVIRGDVNEDGTVDIFDLVVVAAAFGATYNATDGMYWHDPPCESCPHNPKPPPEGPGNPDINNDGIVDLFDIVIVANDFGSHT